MNGDVVRAMIFDKGTGLVIRVITRVAFWGDGQVYNRLGKGEFALGVALGIVLLVVALAVNLAVGFWQSRAGSRS